MLEVTFLCDRDHLRMQIFEDNFGRKKEFNHQNILP
jgi:hypothetical protein